MRQRPDSLAPAGELAADHTPKGPDVPGASSVRSGQLEQIVAQFEDAWQAGQQPAIDDFLPVSDRLRRGVLVELVHADLEWRLKGGEVIRVESYLERYPELANNPDTILDL